MTELAWWVLATATVTGLGAIGWWWAIVNERGWDEALDELEKANDMTREALDLATDMLGALCVCPNRCPGCPPGDCPACQKRRELQAQKAR